MPGYTRTENLSTGPATLLTSMMYISDVYMQSENVNACKKKLKFTLE